MGEIKIHTPIKSIRLKCLDCCAGSSQEVKSCNCADCPLFPYKLGRRPSQSIKKQISNAEPLVSPHCKTKKWYVREEDILK